MTNDEQSTVLAAAYINTGAEFKPTIVMCEQQRPPYDPNSSPFPVFPVCCASSASAHSRRRSWGLSVGN
ncbi:hypothetical protein PC116_g32082 [Phytophthora cactorum]|uniref:Uncharacterized protein n=1 Tax=Phytophthora cactorum TaxID=29920 RepID=A0A8T1A977_9STRA|nr:hypothetical protein PC114_g28058 [Phytophthora cactorum]KAG2873020.1 hypothetical protein PC117_g27907 [Phytophthora cactorum]KAG2956019.1 hypothetical protein PC119_g27846 [Phytophthora cactorum]KAG3112469.1 hypothetical protein C6341_g27805 [Phytophthora cactorum]KAG3146820.1 hypothetical protein PC128_g23931 [Phytophthora cactorum]